MSYILHISDFHIKADGTEDYKKLYDIAKFIKESNYSIKYLVHTGDFIDSKIIYANVCKSIMEKYKVCFGDYVYNEKSFEQKIYEISKTNMEIINKFNDTLIESSKVAFNQTEEIFKKFIDILDISNKNVIVCCGNHDKIRLIDPHKSESKCNNSVYTESDFDKERFKLFNEFCLNLGLKSNSENKKIAFNDMEFLVLNTNYQVPDSFTGSCINCWEVEKIIENYNNKNIIVAHKPSNDLCENFIMSYQRESYTANITKLNGFSNTYLCGDKHTVHETTYSGINMFLCGSPVSGKELIYNLLHFNEKTENYESELIKYQNGKCSIIPTEETCKKVLNISKTYIGETTKDLIKTPDVDSYKKLKKIKAVSNLFKTICKYTNNQSVGVWNGNKTIFKQFYNMIFENDNIANPINIKGECGTGKSLFLGIEYLYMLDLFKKGTLRYIPAYFNVDNVSVDTDVKSSVIREFKIFIDNCNSLSVSLNLPVLYIVDGLDDKDCINASESIEQAIFKIILKQNNHNKYILSFNIYHFPRIKNSLNINYEENNIVIYFNPVDIISIDTNKNKFDIFIESYLDIRGISNTNDINLMKKLIRKYRKINIDITFMHKNFEYLFARKDKNFSSWKVLNDYSTVLSKFCDEFFKDEDEHLLSHSAYLLTYEGYTFSELLNERLINNYSIFRIIKHNNEIRIFLVAKYFCNQILQYSENAELSKNENSILHKFVPRDIGIMMRILFDREGNIDTLTKLVNSLDHEDSLSTSIPLYIVSHMRIQDTLKNEFLNVCSGVTLPELNNFSLYELKNKNEFLKFSSRRTMMISETLCQNKNSVINLLHELIKNNDLRIYNRIYQLLYYGDLVINGENAHKVITPNEDIIHKGFDFHNCFHVLISKLEYSFYLEQRYPLMEFDLFTICDIAYSRIQQPTTILNAEEIETFFYYNGYNDSNCMLAENVLDKIINVINYFIKNKTKYNFELKETDSVYIYFSLMKEKFEEFRNLLINARNDNSKKSQMIEYSYPDYELSKLLKLRDINRIGWNLDTTDKNDDQTRIELSDNKDTSKETILEHVYESMCIALLYLPDVITKLDVSDSMSDDDFARIKKDYDKNRILNYIFMHEFGKCQIKDYTPDSIKLNELKMHKDEDLLSILVLGSVDGFGNMNDYYNAFELEIETPNSNINLRIAQDIGYIQREYKLETLLLNNEISFTENRLRNFRNSTKITTNIGNTIFKVLVKNNPKFQNNP